MRWNRPLCLIVCAILAGGALAPLTAEAAGPDELFFWNIDLAPEKAAPGSVVFVTAEVLIAPKHHVYRKYTEIQIDTAPEISAGHTIFPPGTMIPDLIDGGETEAYEEHAKIGVPLWVAPEVAEGTYPVTVKLTYQGCSDTVCYRKVVTPPPFQIMVAGAPGAATAPPAWFEPLKPLEGEPLPELIEYGEEDLAGKVARLLGRSAFLALPLVFFAGILTSFTPCVYPLIPITVSIFGAREAKSRWSSFFLSLTYVLGIAVMYSVLGVIAASTGLVFGGFMSNPAVIGVVALFFVAMGLSMLGVFAFQAPSGLMNRAAKVRGTGHAAAFGMGLVSGVIASPCTGPVLAVLLATVAATQNLFLGFWMLFVYALGIGVLFILIGTFSGLASSMPKSGAWMEAVKAVFAIILFGMALYFLRNVVPPLQNILGNSLVFYGTVVVFVVLAYLLGAFRGLPGSASTLRKVSKAGGVILASLAVYMFAGSFIVVPEPAVVWQKNSVFEHLEEARAAGRPALVDFYADWCAYCVEMDKKTFSQEQVGDVLGEKGFVTIKADWSEAGSDEENLLRRQYGVHGLPVLLFFDSKGEVLKGKTREGFVGPDELIKIVADIS